MIRIPPHKEPTHPDEMLLEEFLKPMGMIQKELSEAITVPYQRINEIINGKKGITPSTFAIGKVFWEPQKTFGSIYSLEGSL